MQAVLGAMVQVGTRVLQQVLALCERHNLRNAVFCEEFLGKNQALYVYFTYNDVDRFWISLVHEL